LDPLGLTQDFPFFAMRWVQVEAFPERTHLPLLAQFPGLKLGWQGVPDGMNLQKGLQQFKPL